MLKVSPERTYYALFRTLPSNITTPPISPFLCDVVAIDADLPAIVASLTLTSKSNADDLMSEAYTDYLDVLRLGTGCDLFDEIDEL